MSEPIHVAKKRERQPPAPSGNGVVVIGNRFVCSYSGRTVERAIFAPGTAKCCFANVPCAVAWLEENVKDADQVSTLKLSLAEKYDQPLAVLERAPHRQYLDTFGGSNDYTTWIGPLEKWDRLSEVSGTTVDEFSKKNKSGGKKKKGKAELRQNFESATYFIAHGKLSAGVKRVDTIEGNVDAEGKKKSGTTHVGSMRKVFAFAKANEVQKPYSISYIGNEFCYATSFTHFGDEPADPKLHNKIASLLLGEEVYGPAVVVFLKKHSIKIQ